MRWLLILLWLASPVTAQTIAVSSGEHDTYSRLVLPLPDGTEWKVGRTAAGYELALTGEGLRFDLSRVFDLIPKTRLTGAFADPVTGRLQLLLRCVCHALPFQLDGRTLVIDLRDGAAPPGSSFELALDGSAVPPLLAVAQQRPRARPLSSSIATDPAGQSYDWIALRGGGTAAVQTAAPAAGPMRHTNPDLSPLRDTLIRQLSRGAADGVIELALPTTGAEMTFAGETQMRVTKLPGLAVQEERTAVAEVQPDGAACIPDTALALSDWGGEGETALQIAAARSALVGEFDKPDQTAVSQSVRLLLHLGFGAEAELTIGAFGATDPDVPIWNSLARILDDRAQADSPFAKMAGCDTAAALWAVLAAPADTALTGANVPAVQRAFSALPAHLRLHLAPRLAERAESLGNDELARAVITAANRVTGQPKGAQVLLQARVDMADGRLAEVAAEMETLLAEGGPTAAEALILLVQARAGLDEPLAPQIPGIAAAMLQEHAGAVLEPDLRRAWQVSMAAAGDFAGAFAAKPDAPTMAQVWRLLAHVGTDDAVLTYGILPQGAPVTAERAAAELLAERLLGMGFADAASHWLGPLPEDAGEADRLLRAQIDLARADGRAVLSTLAGVTSAEALILKAKAEQMLGQPEMARVTWAVAGDEAASLQAAGWAQQWADVAQGPEGAWQSAAIAVTDQPAPLTGPLAQGKALVEESAAMRANLDLLLSSVPAP